MTILLMLIPVALVLGLAALGGFVWAMRSGQFDDLDGAAQRILFDDIPAVRETVGKGPGEMAPGEIAPGQILPGRSEETKAH